MPIVTKKSKPVTVTKKPQPPVQSQPLESKATPIIKDAKIPTDSILLYVEGSIWPVDYYSQILGKQSELHAQGVGTVPVYQQYTLIKRFELSVTSELSHSEQADTSEFTTTGSATVYPAFIPNEGDMFLADVGDGRTGVFTVTARTRQSIYKESCYSNIEYQLVDYASEARLQDFTNKVVNTYHYHREGIVTGGAPTITGDEYHQLVKLKEHWHSLKVGYWDEFYNVRLNSFTLYQDQSSIYDHYLVDFLSNTVPQDHLSPNEWVTVLNCGQHYNNLRLPTLWQSILTRKPISFYSKLIQSTRLKNYREFHGDPSLAGIRFMGVKEVVYPKNNVSEESKDQSKQLFPVVATDASYYVLSAAFYQNKRAQCSLFERVLMDYLERKPVDLSELIKLCNAIDQESELNRFYLTPMLMAVLISNISGGL